MSYAALQSSVDVEALVLGDRLIVAAGPNLRATGWVGGLWVEYITPPPGVVDDFVVEVSAGSFTAGFMLFPSENYNVQQAGAVPWDTSNDYLGTQFRTEQGAIAGASTLTIIQDGGRYWIKHYETTALNGAGVRAAGPAIYTLNQRLHVSENGLFCNDSDANLIAAGVATPTLVGTVSAVPSSRNQFRLGLDMLVR